MPVSLVMAAKDLGLHIVGKFDELFVHVPGDKIRLGHYK